MLSHSGLVPRCLVYLQKKELDLFKPSMSKGLRFWQTMGRFKVGFQPRGKNCRMKNSKIIQTNKYFLKKMHEFHIFHEMLNIYIITYIYISHQSICESTNYIDYTMCNYMYPLVLDSSMYVFHCISLRMLKTWTPVATPAHISVCSKLGGLFNSALLFRKVCALEHQVAWHWRWHMPELKKMKHADTFQACYYYAARVCLEITIVNSFSRVLEFERHPKSQKQSSFWVVKASRSSWDTPNTYITLRNRM